MSISKSGKNQGFEIFPDSLDFTSPCYALTDPNFANQSDVG